MATPKDVIWDIEPHTTAKHKILKAYLEAWYPILGKKNRRLNYIDGFSGPGKYSGGEFGSPLVVLELTLNHPSLTGVELNFVFIEKDIQRKDNLEREISLLNLPGNFKIQVIPGEFHDVIDGILDQLESTRQILAPTFVFIDPFGFAGIPFTIIERLLRMPKVEVLITFMVNRINQFIGDKNNNQHIVDLFGSEKVIELLDNSSLKRNEILREFYQSQLRNQANAKFVRYFSMKDVNDRPIYDLFFATGNELGHTKMKEAMWKVDKEGFFRFSDATDQNQTALFERDTSKELFTIINQKKKENILEVKDIRKFIENKTPFLKKHMTECLRYAEENNFILVEPMKSNGEKRREKTFPDEVIINFI